MDHWLRVDVNVWVPCSDGASKYTQILGRSDRGVLAITERFSTWKARNRDPWIQASQEFFSTLLAGGWRHLAPSCSVHGQDGPLPRRATVSPAPPPPHATRSESMAPQILRLGPPSSDPKIQPAGASGKVRCPQIGCVRPLLRWIITTRAWLGAVKSTIHRRFSRSAFGVGLICCRGVRARLSAQACEEGRPRLWLRHRWGRSPKLAGQLRTSASQ